ncbi:Ni/Fe-hydrogenase, b-type cytochrome subunit [Azospirillum doebereinerae]|uniref:Ni/Fe-hydrogenase, b-type cytochrome subunit n=1 Tax=Azospirillum doebereinerae TaxID=92933 RepID=UPI00384ACD11
MSRRATSSPSGSSAGSTGPSPATTTPSSCSASPFWDGHWWAELFVEARWYLFLEREPKLYVGHNPLAQFAMFWVIGIGSVFMIVTGFALYGEGAGVDSWQDRVFGWVIPLFGQSQDVHTWHHLGMWAILLFVMVHIYAAVREDIMSRQSIVSTMVSGVRTFKDAGQPADEDAPAEPAHSRRFHAGRKGGAAKTATPHAPEPVD